MPPIHSLITRFASPMLAVVLACLSVGSAHAADVFRLDRVAVVRFTDLGDGRLRRQTGVLSVTGELTWRITSDMARPGDFPAVALGRVLISQAAWTAYYSLGAEATRYFRFEENGEAIGISGEVHYYLGVDSNAAPATGQLVNLSTRARMGTGDDIVIGGFVIEGRPRKVLIRGVGPSLAQFKVADRAADPRIVLMKDGQRLLLNDNWNQNTSPADIRAAAVTVGAFPLDEGSADAALLVELQPGSYTVLVESAVPGSPSGLVLVEVYSVPG